MDDLRTYGVLQHKRDMKYRSKHILEYALLRVLTALLRILPYRAALFIGWLNAWFAFHVVRFRVDEAKRRIRTVLGENVSDKDTTRIAWQSWKNIIFSSVEMMRMDLMTRKWIESVLDAEELFATLKNQTDTGHGAISAVAHMGSWELAGVYGHLIGIPVFTFVAQQNNPLVNAYLNRLRQRPGIEVISRGTHAVRDILRHLKNGYLLAILPDVRMRQGGMMVPFLGGEANVGEGMAMFARHCNVPIFPSIITRQGWTHHKGKVGPTIWPDSSLDKEADILRMTREVLCFIDEEVRRDPGQWFWFNKRWILDPVE